MTDRAALDLSRPRRIHVVGLGGAGMSAIATVLVAMGHRVSGSDMKDSVALQRLTPLGVRVAVGHDAGNVGDAEVLTRSTAVPDSNVEVRAARHAGLAVLSRADTLAAICDTRRTLAVSGTHGKTTTSSMLALVLVEGGLEPSYIIGGDINEVGAGAVWGSGDTLVVEADESDGSFLFLGAHGVVVTSLEPDHLDHYGSLEALEAAFARFVSAAPGPRVVCADEPGAAALAEPGVITYGTAPDATYRIRDVVLARSGAAFDVDRGDRALGRFELSVPGIHNVRNATAALAMATELGVDVGAARRALGRFGGVARRFEFRGARHGVTFVDDYGHLPGEVAATLAAARSGGWGRVVAVFQPHRYSRTAFLWREFADAFQDADVVVVTDVYGAGEAPRPGVGGHLIVDAVRLAHPDQSVIYAPHRDGLRAELQRVLRPGDLCLTLGAGDLTTLPDELLGAEQ